MSTLRLPVQVSAALLAIGVLALIAAVVGDPWSFTLATVPLLGSQFTLGLSLDAVPAVLLTFIAGLALITAEYSRRNLRGQQRLGRYARLHVTATLALALLVTGASLPLLALGWTVSGLAIAALVAHRGTPAARRAAGYVRNRLLVGDALLWAGVVVAAVVLPSLDRSALAAGVAASPAAGVTAVALLLVAAAVVRSALVPSHRWLFETAEAPSPVSAMLHAGVVNAVGLLGVLVWPILAASWSARALLIVVGIGTAAALSVAMRYRADVKGRLAASTSAQMGYLSLTVGLGLPLAGLLHLIGHGCYKAHLFLRAGGEVTRARTSLGALRAAARPLPTLVALAAVGVAALVGLATWTSVPLADALPITVALAAAAVAAVTAANPGTGLRRVASRAAATTALLLVPACLALYLVVLGAWSSAFGAFEGAAQVWSATSLIAWFALIALTAAGVAAVMSAIDDGRAPVLRAWIGAASLRPGDRVRGAVRLAADPLTTTPLDPAMASIAVDAASVVVGPVWPLRTAVAANPLAGLHDLSVEDAGVVARRTWGARTTPDRSIHLRAYASGRITDADLGAAAERCEALPAGHSPVLIRDILLAVSAGPITEDMLTRSAAARRLAELPDHQVAALNEALGDIHPTRTLTEEVDAGTGGGARLAEIADAHAAAWLTDLLAAPDRAELTAGGLWGAWRERVSATGLDAVLGVPGFGAAVRALPADPAAALAELLPAARPEPADHVAYLGRLLARQPGWSGHLAYREFIGGEDLRPDLLAIRSAYDVLLARAAGAGAPRPDVQRQGAAPGLVDATACAARALGWRVDDVDLADVAELLTVAELAAVLAGPVGDGLWQDAYEQRYRNRMLDRIEARAAAGPQQPAEPADVHLAMCIDVRSERFRRHLEADPGIDTYGFAGFFGLFLRHEPDAGRVSDQCPVLLQPNHTLAEHIHHLPARQGAARLLGAAASAAGSAPGTPFALAEASAPVAGLQAAVQTLLPTTWKRGRDWLRGAPELGLRGDLGVAAALPLQARADAAHGFLTAIGLTAPSAPLLVLAGHGSAVENNAYAAAYDCGACGGNSGYVNARSLAAMLNDPQVRAEVAARGIVIPESTVAVPALHVTTTDALVIADADVPPHAAAAVAALRERAAIAQGASAAERVATLPAGDLGNPVADVQRRAADWAEATPEWGLAGNALFVVGPRWMTRGLNLHGRSFLHSYDPQADPARAVLEVILTAPMVVTHWINSQYYASTVDPEAFGAGDKTTHNVVGDIAVLAGAHGDLRVGLPWQGLFDADPVEGVPTVGHEPMRLQVVVYAPRADVLAILQRHPGVARLITNGWLALAVIEPQDAQLHRLTRSLAWEPWDVDPVAAAVQVTDAEIADAEAEQAAQEWAGRSGRRERAQDML